MSLVVPLAYFKAQSLLVPLGMWLGVYDLLIIGGYPGHSLTSWYVVYQVCHVCSLMCHEVISATPSSSHTPPLSGVLECAGVLVCVCARTYVYA